MKRFSTGIKALDETLNGGFPDGSTVLIVGRPGSGKTILAHQIMFHNATPENKMVYLTTLAEPQVKVMKFQQEFLFFDQNKFQKSVIYQDMGSILRKNGPRHALVMIDEILKKHQPGLIVVDTIKTLADMIPSLTDFREFLLDLSLRLATWGCTALLLGEYAEEDIEFRPESAIADGIICLYGTEEKKQQKRLLRILKMRGSSYTGGEIVFRITEQGITIFPRINPNVSTQTYDFPEERIAIGIPGLDQMIGGGIPRSTTTLVSGASGTGKTLLAIHFAHCGLKAGESVVYVTFEENPQQIVRSARCLGLELQSFLDQGKLHLLHVSPIELDVDEHVFAIQRTVQDTGSRRLVIDSISSFEIGMHDKVKYTDYIWAISDYFKTQGVNVLFTHEMHDSADVSKLTKHGISFVADNLLALRYLEQGLEIKRFLRVIKMRGSNHASNMRELLIGSGGLSIGEILML